MVMVISLHIFAHVLYGTSFDWLINYQLINTLFYQLHYNQKITTHFVHCYADIYGEYISKYKVNHANTSTSTGNNSTCVLQANLMAISHCGMHMKSNAFHEIIPNRFTLRELLPLLLAQYTMFLCLLDSIYYYCCFQIQYLME
jgi:hypothetical protein